MFKLRQLLTFACAALVVVTCVQMAVDTPHDVVSASAEFTEAEFTVAVDGAGDPSLPHEDVEGRQHEHAASVDHAMIAAETASGLRGQAGRVRIAMTATHVPSGHAEATLDRPPRA